MLISTAWNTSSAASLDGPHLADLMGRYQGADLSAADELVTLLSPLLLRFLSGPYYTRQYNEDILQDCWLQVHRARHTFRSGSPLLPWIFAIARHVRCNAYRRQLRIHSHEFAMDPLPDPAAITWPETHAKQHDFLWALDFLPETQREVLFMEKVLGMSLEEIAQATSCSVGGVKQKAHRAYQTLRKLLSRQAPREREE